MLKKIYAPAACPYLTGTPDGHSLPAAPSSITPAAAVVAVPLLLAILGDSVDVADPHVAGSRSSLGDGRP